MFSRISKHSIIVLLLISLVVPSSLLLYPQKATAQTNCVAVVGGAIAAALAIDTTKQTTGVTTGTSDSKINAVGAGAKYGSFFSDCVLKPIAIKMARTMVRQISNSIVNWINGGFNGRPGFVTDIRGLARESADEVIGNFIYGSDLKFLCQPFSVKIRLALATKYAKPFQEEVKCTLSQVVGNVNGFVNNNGGNGWNNWLAITTQPQNNVYGAYLMADTQLTQNVQGSLDKLNNMINRNGGFLDFETCDAYETQLEANARVYGAIPVTNSLSASTITVGNQPSTFQTFTAGTPTTQTIQFGAGGTAVNVPVTPSLPTFTSSLTQSKDATPKCKPGRMTTKTPGSLVQQQASKVLGSWADQLNLATEIDQIIGALISSFTEKMVSGAQGFLGLSNSGSGYANQSVSYNQAVAAAANLSLPENAGLSQVNTAITTTGNTALENLNAALLETANNTNIAKSKTATMSSPGIGSLAFITDGDFSTSAGTGENANPWIEIDLGESVAINEIKISGSLEKSLADSLGTFNVTFSNNSGGRDFVSSTITANNTTVSPIVVPVLRTGRYIRVNRINNSYSCGTGTCYYPLTIGEIEVTPDSSGVVNTGGGNTGVVTLGGPTGSQTLEVTINPSSTSILSDGVLFTYESSLNTNYLTGELNFRVAFKNANTGADVPFFSAFSIVNGEATFFDGATQAMTVVSPAQALINWPGIGTDTNKPFKFKIIGMKKSGAPTGNYLLQAVVYDRNGTNIKTVDHPITVQ